MASVLPAARAGQVESEASEMIRRFGRRRAWLGPNPGLPPHLGDSLSSPPRAPAHHCCGSEQFTQAEPHAAAAATPSAEPKKKQDSHRVSFKRFFYGAFPLSASALFAASRSSRFDMYDWRPRSRHLSHFDGCFAYFVAHFSSFSRKKWACKNFLQPLHHLKCCCVLTWNQMPVSQRLQTSLFWSGMEHAASVPDARRPHMTQRRAWAFPLVLGKLMRSSYNRG